MMVKRPRSRIRFASRERTQLSPPLTYDWLEHDFAKDPGPLIKVLDSGEPLPEHLRQVLVDLFERYRLRLKPGAKRIPSYRRLSDSEAKLEAAHEEYRDLKLGRHGREAAVKQLAKDWEINENTLLNKILDKRGSSRRR